jgi:hypothetical protein
VEPLTALGDCEHNGELFRAPEGPVVVVGSTHLVGSNDIRRFGCWCDSEGSRSLSGVERRTGLNCRGRLHRVCLDRHTWG